LIELFLSCSFLLGAGPKGSGKTKAGAASTLWASLRAKASPPTGGRPAKKVTDIPSSDPDFERLLALVVKKAEAIFERDGKPFKRSKFKALAMKTDPCFAAVSEAFPD